jgi:putative membrane protein
MFYIVRLFIYHREAQDKPEPEKSILSNQYTIMIKRLWLGITWPSAILTLLFGPTLWMMIGNQSWLMIKLCFVLGLYFYHFSLHILYKQQLKGQFKYSSGQLRIWNEVATIFLFAIVMIAVVKTGLSLVWGLGGLAALMILLMSGINLYKKIRKGN